MLHLVLYGLLAIIVAGGLFLVASRFLPAGEQIAPPLRDEPAWDLPAGRALRAEDIDSLRLPVALRGYRFAETDVLLDRLAGELRARDDEIARLRGGTDHAGPGDAGPGDAGPDGASVDAAGTVVPAPAPAPDSGRAGPGGAPDQPQLPLPATDGDALFRPHPRAATDPTPRATPPAHTDSPPPDPDSGPTSPAAAGDGDDPA